MAIRTAICATVLLFISGCSANSYHTSLETPESDDARLTELIQAEADAGYLDPFECDNHKSPVLSFRERADIVCANEDLRLLNRKIGHSLVNARQADSRLIKASRSAPVDSVSYFGWLPRNIQKATQRIRSLCGHNDVQCYSGLMEHLNDSYSGGPHYSETFSAYAKKKNEKRVQDLIDHNRKSQLDEQARIDKALQKRADEIAEARHTLQNHSDPLAVQFGHCEDIAAIGHELFCEGSKIATIREVKNLVLQHGVSKKTGQKYSDLERRQMDFVLTRTMAEMGLASLRNPGVMAKKYGLLLFEIVAEAVG